MQPIDVDEFSGVIEAVYDTVLDPARWPAALEKTCAFVRAAAANVFWQDAVRPEAVVLHAFGDDPAFTASYQETFGALNPFFPALAFVEPGLVVAGSDLIPQAEFRQTRFYQEWVRPQGFVDALAANLQRYPTSSACFSLRRSERDGEVDPDARRRLALLVPHVQRAVLVSREIDRRAAEAGSLAAVLNGVSIGVFLIDPACRLSLANDAGHELLRQSGLFRGDTATLSFRDPAADRALRRAARASGGNLPLNGHRVSIDLGPDQLAGPDAPGWQATVLPLASGARRQAWLGFDACAAVFVRRAELPVTSAIERAARQFRLTPGELRVLDAVFRHDTVGEIAEALGSSPSTIKTHLAALFGKSGSRSRADLIKVVLAGGDPLH